VEEFNNVPMNLVSVRSVVPRLSFPSRSGSILGIPIGIDEHCCDSESILLRIDFGGIPPRPG